MRLAVSAGGCGVEGAGPGLAWRGAGWGCLVCSSDHLGYLRGGKFGWRCQRLVVGQGSSLGCAEGASEGGCRAGGC